MEIKLVTSDKKEFLDLLLLADEQESTTVPFFQRQGYGKRLIEFLFEYYQGKCSEMLVGTGDVPSSRSFYEHCGFVISHRIKNFFTDNYDHSMYEDGVQLVDMIYLKKTF